MANRTTETCYTLETYWPTCGNVRPDPVCVPVSTLPLLARTLGVSAEELIGDDAVVARGRAPKLLQHMERVSALPKPRQRAVIDVIEATLAQQGR